MGGKYKPRGENTSQKGEGDAGVGGGRNCHQGTLGSLPLLPSGHVQGPRFLADVSSAWSRTVTIDQSVN